MTATARIAKTLFLIVLFSLQLTMVSCTKETEKFDSLVTPSKAINTPLSSSIPATKPSFTPSALPTTTTTPPTPTPIPEPKRNEVYFDERGVNWLECNVPEIHYQKWSLAEKCFGISLPARDEEDKLRFGKRFYQSDSVLDDIRLTIGKDTYETVNFRSENDINYVLLKNGTAIASKHAGFTSYNPNRSLLNVGGMSVWELAGHFQPTVFFNGENTIDLFDLEAAYVPYGIDEKLIFTAKKKGKFFIIYGGEQLVVCPS